ncbi:Gfo/Idh/MocA family protein [Microlunatus soli]|uniref:Predicted dehydrogenase n=1 Tax=Microlunatus soli TaxID=630515 RepID=A0A1H1R7N4_9ACTN|nr:Gfo/Idh/MocA family oxidoreductase [Microlunatus soli]SDS31713.1 Predicted dehydrogenase [Microlunatus soli]
MQTHTTAPDRGRPDDDPPLRIGIVGAGIMGQGNALAMSQQRGVEITAVTSATANHADALADEIAGRGRRRPVVHADLDQLLADQQVDAVVLTTPDDLHGPMMVAAARADKHILVEKPFTTSVAEADRAVAAIREAGVVAMCLFNHRWVPAYAQAKELSAGLGAPAVGYARKNDTLYVPTEMLSWAHRTTCAWFLSSHDIDLMSWLIDDQVIRVFATARTGKLQSLGIDTPDAIQIQAEYSRGAVATFESAWIYPNTFPTMVDSYVTLTCADGVIQLDRQTENVVVADPSGVRYPRNLLQRVVHGVPAGAYADAIAHFLRCCRTGEQPLISVESSRSVTAVLEAAHHSISTRQPVDIPHPTGRVR